MRAITRRLSAFFAWLFGRGGMKRTILIPFALLILLGFGIGWTVYVRGSREAVLGTVDLLAVEASSRIRDRLRAYLRAAYDVAALDAAFLGGKNETERPSPELAAAFRRQLQSLDNVELLAVGFSDGEYVEAQRLSDGRIRLGRAGTATGGDLVIEGTDEEGSPLAEELRRAAYDPRLRPWYRAAAESGRGIWTAPYAIVSSGELAMAAAIPIYDHGRLRAVVAADLRLGALSDFLAAVTAEKGGYAYVADELGRLVAASDGRSLVEPNGTRRLGLDELGAPGSAALDAAFVRGKAIANVSIEGADYRAIHVLCSAEPGLAWSLLLALPTTDFLAPISALDLRTGYIIVATLAGALILAFLAAHRIAQPLRSLGRAIAGLDLLPSGEALRTVTLLAARDDEIGHLAQAFEGLSARLEESFASIRSSLAEKEVLLKEVHHRVKNNLQIVSSLLSLQAGASADPSVRQSFELLQDRVHAMAFVHEEMYGSQNFSSVRMEVYLEKICDSLSMAREEEVEIRVAIAPHDLLLPLEKALPCGLIVSELVTNALKHAFVGRERGLVSVSLSRSEEACLLRVSDDGAGFPLTGMAARTGIGSSLVESLSGQLKGRLSMETGQGGTRISLNFPA